MKHILIAAVIASFAFSANASSVKRGQELVAKGACIACHGENLNKPAVAEYPKLAGQPADYLYHALKSYKVSNNPNLGRSNAIMVGQMAQYSDKDMKDMAAYISSLPGTMVMKK